MNATQGSSRASRPALRTLDEALAELLSHAQPLPTVEWVSTFDADGRVLATDLVSELQVPPQDNSSMDGYAVRSREIADEGVTLPVSQRIPAGSAGAPLVPGTAARIFTGAPIPEGADAVVMQEDAEAAGSEAVRILRVPAPGQWVRRSGEDVTKGAVVLHQGKRLGPAALGMAASIGVDPLPVSPRPRVALFSTGDELVMPGQVQPAQMRPGAIYNSNRFFLMALLRRLGCVVTDFGIVPDRREPTIEALRLAARDHDLILTSGGVSVGEEDHVKPAVEALGSLDLWQIAIKPGKPFAYGKVGSAHFMGLPGNPVSSFVTFVVLVRPFLLKLQGAARLFPRVSLMPAGFDWPRPDRRREFLRARRRDDGTLELFPNQSSAVLTSAVWADGLIDTPAGATFSKGEPVRFISLAELIQ
jgi:molybdopterin molybdotransferase